MSNSVTIQLLAFHGCGADGQLNVQTGSLKAEILVGKSASLSSVPSGGLIQLSIALGEAGLATSSLSVDQLTQSEQTVWLKFKSIQSASSDLRAKITVSKIQSQDALNDCPYLQMLSEGKVDDKLTSRIKNRGPSEVRTMRINFEPDAPSRLGVEIKSYEPDSLSSLDSARLESIGGDQIKKQVKSLSEEIKSLGTNSVCESRKELHKQVEERVQQEKSFEQYTENVVLEITEQISALWNLEDQRAALQQKINSAEDKQLELEIEINAINGQIGGLQREILMLKAERLRFRDLENLLESSQNFQKAQIENLKKLEQKFEDSKEQTNKVRNNTQGLISKLEHEANEFVEKLKKVAETENEITEHNQKLKGYLSELKLKLSQQKNPDSLDPTKSSDQRYAGLTKLQTVQSEAFDYDQESKLKYKSSMKQKHSSYDNLLNGYKAYEEANHRNLEKTLENYVVSNELIYMEQSCCIVGDLSNLNDTLGKFNEFYTNTSKAALKCLDSTTSEVLKETNSIKNECDKIGEIMDNVLDKDSETDRVKAIMAEIKERHPPFIPTLDDPIDIALFEYMKSCEEPIPVPFTREEQGVYLFGTKRIFLKLENGNIAIRIGGGFTSIQNFIEIYTPIELERQEEAIEEAVPTFKNSQARFNHSPQKGMSPLRAARILQGTVEVQASGTPIKAVSPVRKTPVKK